MAADDRSPGDPLIARLIATAPRFAFYQAVDLLERRYARDGARVGGFAPPEEEVLRFRPHASLGFPKADIERIETRLRAGAEADLPLFRLTVTFLGLYGAAAPLPAFYTEAILAAEEGESARRDFMDLFHHRLISLQYRLWVKYRYYLRYEAGANDRTSEIVYSFFGLGPKPARTGLRLLYLERLLASAGLLAMNSRSPSLLTGLISYYFRGLAVAIEPFVPRRVAIPDDQRIRLGRANARLGDDMTLGATLNDIAGKFRLVLGPLNRARFEDFLPDGRDHGHLVELVNTLLREPLDFEFELRLDSAERPALTLDRDNPCRLGWMSWLGTPKNEDCRVRLTWLGRQVRLPTDPFEQEAA